jgi:hypothetical protein
MEKEMTDFFIELDKNIELICKIIMILIFILAIIAGTVFYIKIIFFSKEKDRKEKWSTACNVKLGDIIYPRWSSNFFTEGKRYIVKNIYRYPNSREVAYIIAKNDLEEEQECCAEYFYFLNVEKK